MVVVDCCWSPSLLFDAIEFRDVVELLCNGALEFPVAEPTADEDAEGDCDGC